MQLPSFMRNLILALFIGISASGFLAGCGEEVEHKETDRPNLIGSGRTHTEETVTRNPDGTYTTEREKTRTNP